MSYMLHNPATYSQAYIVSQVLSWQLQLRMALNARDAGQKYIGAHLAVPRAEMCAWKVSYWESLLK